MGIEISFMYLTSDNFCPIMITNKRGKYMDKTDSVNKLFKDKDIDSAWDEVYGTLECEQTEKYTEDDKDLRIAELENALCIRDRRVAELESLIKRQDQEISRLDKFIQRLMDQIDFMWSHE